MVLVMMMMTKMTLQNGFWIFKGHTVRELTLSYSVKLFTLICAISHVFNDYITLDWTALI